MSVPLILASASPARLATLRRAGVKPTVVVSDVDEEAVLADAQRSASRAETPHRTTSVPLAEIPLILAKAKCLSVAARPESAGRLVVGCDSLLELDGVLQGKPHDADEAATRWRLMSGRQAVLHTGHWLVDRRSSLASTGFGAVASTVIHFAVVDEDEISAYVATGEPLHVAGAFTIDGLGGPFVESIEGDPHNVVGISLPLLRQMLKTINLRWADIASSDPTNGH